MKITYEDHMGSDLKTVNMARVSFKKRSDYEYEMGSHYLKEKDKNLIEYLAKHKHWAPFAHNVLTVHVKAPVAIARQLFKHKIAFIESEVSRRYVDDLPEWYVPEFREKSPDKKQGSLGLHAKNEHYQLRLEQLQDSADYLYSDMIKDGIAPEDARFALLVSTYTEWYLTGSLPAFHRMYQLRTSEDAQKETQEIVLQLDGIIEPLYPLSWKALKAHG